MLGWARQFNIFCFLDNQQYPQWLPGYECLLAAGAAQTVQGHYGDLKKLDAFTSAGAWSFGHLCYELLHPYYNIGPIKKDAIGFPPFFFFQPQHLLFIKEGALHIEAANPDEIFAAVSTWAFEKVERPVPVTVVPQLSRAAYIERVQQLQQHILRGDCYEINFCTAAVADNAMLDPVAVFQNLMQLSAAPFSALYKLDDKYLISASPERFLAKNGSRLIAQPIKGTARRSNDATEDAAAKKTLQASAKERAENVMIVDLMRNDLSKVCQRGSVVVDELAGLYSFPQVHQLISTVSGWLPDAVSFSEIMEATFPMGSMTGAPKRRVLELIDQYEPSARGLFSGSVGYIAPNGDFDFNVVIRSVLYNESLQRLSYQVGSAITFYSNAEQEWEECLLKASAIKKVLAEPDI